MRVSSLSDERVQRLLKQYYVSVWGSSDDYQCGKLPAAERAAVDNVHRQRREKGLEGGAVCVYLLDKDGDLGATLIVQKASKPDQFVPLLQKFLEGKKVEPRDAEGAKAAYRAVAAVRDRSKDGLLLHVWARQDDAGANRGVSQDWVDLAASEWAKLRPADDAREGTTWQVPDNVADRVFQQFYPPGPFWTVKEVKMVARSLSARVAGVDGDAVKVRLEGTFELTYPAEWRPVHGRVKGSVVGYLTYDRGKKAITDFRLTTTEGEYTWSYQGKPQRPTHVRVAVEREP
jgi:hypothetical protein